jgi:hypothetical protein
MLEKVHIATVDKTKIVAAGQFCGGVQTDSPSLDKRITLIGIFKNGLLNPDNTLVLGQLHHQLERPLGPKDIAYENFKSI